MIFNPGLVPQASGGAVYGTYTGGGQKTLSLTFDIEPAMVIICGMKDEKYPTQIIIMNGMTECLAINSSSSTNLSVSFNGNTLTLSTSQNAAGYFNGYGTAYYYIAFPKA